jgi:predicted secreted Zn-dependent protease
MMSRVLILLLCVFRLNILSQADTNNNSNIKEWEECCQLEWSDFRGNRNKGSSWEAAASVGIKIFNFKWNNNTASGKVIAFFNRNYSWTEIETDEGLSHEQGHFDLTEIYARLIRKELTSKKNRKKSISHEIDRIYDKYNNALNLEQDLYDLETDHHKNRTEQLKWDKKIKQRLLKLNKFEDTTITIRIW